MRSIAAQWCGAHEERVHRRTESQQGAQAYRAEAATCKNGSVGSSCARRQQAHPCQGSTYGAPAGVEVANNVHELLRVRRRFNRHLSSNGARDGTKPRDQQRRCTARGAAAVAHTLSQRDNAQPQYAETAAARTHRHDAFPALAEVALGVGAPRAQQQRAKHGRLRAHTARTAGHDISAAQSQESR